MIKITNLTLRNFLSVGAVTLAVVLDKHGLTLVLGANTDANGGLTRNGAGKTTILQAISYALYGQPISKIKADNLINNINQKGMLVTIEFERDGNTYRVERGRKPNVLRFFINNTEVKEDENDTAQGENRHTQEEIERVVGMSHTMFKHIVALNTYTDPFLRMRVGDQREVIEELLGVTQISQRAETLKKLLGQTKESMRDQEALIKATLEANNRIEGAIKHAEQLSKAWKLTHEKRLRELSDEIEAMQAIDYDAEIATFERLDEWLAKDKEIRDGIDNAKREIEHYTRDLAALNNQLGQLSRDNRGDVAAQVSRLNSEWVRKDKETDRKRGAIIDKKRELGTIIEQLSNPDNQICVCCDQKLTGTDHLETVLANLRSNQTAVETSIARLETELAQLENEMAGIKTEIAALEAGAEAARAEIAAKTAEITKQAEEPKEKIEFWQSMLENWAAPRAALGDKPETLFGSRDEVYKAKQLFDGLARDLEIESQKVDPNEQQIETLKATMQKVDYEPLNDLSTLYKHQEFLLKLLTSKDSFIRKKIIDQNLSYLNSRLNHYLDKLGLPHEVTFQSDLSVDITLLGRDFDFEQLSRGEMNRVIMATSWSFRDVWESLNETFNLLFVDEMLDQGTDGQGVEAALGILKGMARDRNKNVFLISHRDDLTARIDRTLLVRKENGFTRFEEDALA